MLQPEAAEADLGVFAERPVAYLNELAGGIGSRCSLGGRQRGSGSSGGGPGRRLVGAPALQLIACARRGEHVLGAPALGRLPPFSSSPAPGEAGKLAQKRNADALRLHLAGKHAEAAPLFKQAVAADPSLVLPRYNLGCALSRLGERERALAVLGELKAAGCKDCLTQIAFARQDIDWKSLWSDPAFKAMTAVAEASRPSPKVVVRALSAAFSSGKTEQLEPFLPASAKIKYTHIHSLGEEGRDRLVTLYSAADFQAFASKLLRLKPDEPTPTWNDMASPRCDAACCEAQRRGLNHNNIYLDRVCVHYDTEGRAFLSSVDILDGD